MPAKRIGFTAFFLASALLLFPVLSFAGAKPSFDGEYKKLKFTISSLIRKEMIMNNIKGASIALVDDGKIVWAEGFGYADEGANIHATPETVYRTGSISKLFTVLGAMKLKEEGKLELDAPLSRYVPEFSIKSRFTKAAPITIRSLMTHHSGIPSDYTKGMWTKNPEPLTAIALHMKDEYAAHPPGYIVSYSNSAFTLLGNAVQNASGRDFCEYENETLLKPIGMESSFFDSDPSKGKNISKGYYKGDETELWPTRDTPAAGLSASAVDLAKFMITVMNGGVSPTGARVISQSSLAETMTRQNENVPLDLTFKIGLGWWLGPTDLDYAGKVAFHGGATIAFRSELIVLPERKLGVVVLMNTSNAWILPDIIGSKTLELALKEKYGLDRPEPAKAKDSPEKPLTAEEGKENEGYYVTPVGISHVTYSDGRLYANIKWAKFRLINHEDGGLSAKYMLFGLLPLGSVMPPGARLNLKEIAGVKLAQFEFNHRKFALAEKVYPEPIPEKWKSRVGEYEIMNINGDFPDNIGKAELKEEEGFLEVAFTSPFSSGVEITVPLKIVSDTEAVSLGLWRGRGETVRIITVDGTEQAVYMGYRFKKKEPRR